jgi:23S rRNA (adenine2030-N6)-methyltransferase
MPRSRTSARPLKLAFPPLAYDGSRMFGYQHDHHAGNHADVVKHAVLVLLIEALQRKAKPLRVIDCHAGAGYYDLTSAAAQHGREYSQGIARLLDDDPPPPEIARYIELVKASNDGTLRAYPGSPQIARALLREDDHLELFELHPQAYAALEKLLAGDRRVHMHRRDAYEGLLAVLPPPERRGMALIDPSYEGRGEFDKVLDLLPRAQAKWPNGALAVWYPLLRKAEAGAFVRRLRALELPRLFQVEIRVAPSGGLGLLGSGLVISNLPYGLDAPLKTLMPWLHHRLATEGGGSSEARWLTSP